jgi:ornithine cyclodeaminase
VDNVRDIDKLILYSIDPLEKREKFREILGEILDHECDIVFSNDAAQAVREADIVTLITSAKDPIVNGDWFKSGTHINGVGSHAPAMRELDTKTVQISKVFCDLVEACAAEAGDFMIPVEAGDYQWDEIHGSMGDVITEKITGRENDEEITLFKSVGLAIQDISVAFHVYNKAVGMDVGTDFEF